jgi:hypothetical protein
MVLSDVRLRSAVNSDGGAILDIPRNQITTLNATGAFIWRRLQDGRTVDQAVQDLAIESNTDQLVVERDAHAFLDQLKANDLLAR